MRSRGRGLSFSEIFMLRIDGTRMAPWTGAPLKFGLLRWPNAMAGIVRPSWSPSISAAVPRPSAPRPVRSEGVGAAAVVSGVGAGAVGTVGAVGAPGTAGAAGAPGMAGAGTYGTGVGHGVGQHIRGGGVHCEWPDTSSMPP